MQCIAFVAQGESWWPGHASPVLSAVHILWLYLLQSIVQALKMQKLASGQMMAQKDEMVSWVGDFCCRGCWTAALALSQTLAMLSLVSCFDLVATLSCCGANGGAVFAS